MKTIQRKKPAAIIVIAAAILLGVILTGCTAPGQENPGQVSTVGQAGDHGPWMSDQPDGSPPDFGRGPPRFNGSGNLTDAQRQAFAQQRMQAVTGACQGMKEGDACTLAGRRTNTTGTCQTQNNTLLCVLPRPSGQYPYRGQNQ